VSAIAFTVYQLVGVKESLQAYASANSRLIVRIAVDLPNPRPGNPGSGRFKYLRVLHLSMRPKLSAQCLLSSNGSCGSARKQQHQKYFSLTYVVPDTTATAAPLLLRCFPQRDSCENLKAFTDITECHALAPVKGAPEYLGDLPSDVGLIQRYCSSPDLS
jgi:hypothetical protein